MTETEDTVLSFGDDFENPFAMVKDWQRETIKGDFEALARDWVRLRLKGPGPVTELRQRKASLDSMLAHEQPEFRSECLYAFARTLGLSADIWESLSKREQRDRLKYVDRIPDNDPDLGRISYGVHIASGAALFIKVMTDLDQNRSITDRFIGYLADDSRNNGLVVDGVIRIKTLIPVYCQWLAYEYQSTQHS